jgi:thiamine biosynthesis lipoprotein
MFNISRRKFLKISAISISIPFASNVLLANNLDKTTWEGKALGANANMTLFHKNPDYSKETIDICINEVRRLEKVFSLFDKDSDISILNKQGFINNPPIELVEILQFAHTLSKNTNGAFDVSVQPLWNVHEKFFKNNNTQDIKKFKQSIKKAKKLVSYKNIYINTDKISFKQEKMKITLNGIAQGYITDKITDILRQKGFKNVLVDLGEINSIGGYDDKRDWNIATPYLNDRKHITLNNMAVASSGGYGTKFNEMYHHLFDTKTGTSANYSKAVTVTAKSAMLADALSTAIYVMPTKKSEKLKKFYPNINIYIS